MKTLSQLLRRLQEHMNGRIELRYVHPLVYVLCIDEEFGGRDNEERHSILAAKIDCSIEELQAIVARGSLQLAPVTRREREIDYAFLDNQESGQHWLSWYAHLSDRAAPATVEGDTSRALHFYGFKGGQARSTVLVLLAKLLADDGFSVLVVDADIEAPSLDAVFDVAAETTSATLMGLCGWSNEIEPLPRVYVGHPTQGTIDLLACRPRSIDYDLDFAGFLLGSTLDARLLERASIKLRSFANASSKYDYVLFDHRTGLASSVLPLLTGWPGPTVVFIRPDGMSRHLEHSSALRALLAHDRQSPGAFVTFSLDPKQTAGDFLQRHGKFVEGLLEGLSDALTTEEDIDPSELQRYWVLWNHDASLLGQTSLDPQQLGSMNRKALSQLREVLGIEVGKEINPPTLTKSGATDEGLFILTPDIARLFSVDSRILYIFGRKGTGKTRLLKELSQGGFGTPLLVAQDFAGGGIPSGGATFNALLQRSADDYETFWWALLLGALNADPSDPSSLNQQVLALSQTSISELRKEATAANTEALIASMNWSARRVLLIDGVETAVPAAKLRLFVESLFRFLGTVRYSQVISNALSIRLFLRSDLHKSAAQNIEQQIEGSVLDLRWDRKSILNFSVARIHSLSWFKTTFRGVWDKIDKDLQRLSRGALSELEAEELLLEIFPKDLERNKIKTTTFFATYFSDAGGESDAKASFYPRLFDGFLRTMNDAPDHSDALQGNRLKSTFVLRSYDAASTAFINEVRTELHNLLELESEDTANRDAVNKLLDAFSGLKTPFDVEDIVKDLAVRTGYAGEQIRNSLSRMKQLGIFEDRPGYPGWWRTGRLYKSGLAMKYVRNSKVAE
ncbi:hypothetical protein [Roseateles sp. P5_E7]